jgi:uncharacterized protein YprB with RNaseH-like and TPR domain
MDFLYTKQRNTYVLQVYKTHLSSEATESYTPTLSWHGIMLAWDIETTGLNKHKDLVTVISFYDPEANIDCVLRFVDLNFDCELVYADDYLEKVAKMVDLLDNAKYLCAYNSTSFDSPFIQIQFKLDNAKVQSWIEKTFDILEITRRGFGRTFNLNSCLALNNFDVGKSGSCKASTCWRMGSTRIILPAGLKVDL